MRTRSLSLAVVAIMAIHLTTTAQTVYQLPFASVGNSIELSVANTAMIALAGVKVEATNLPSWLKFVATEQRIPLLKANQELPAAFTFSVDKTAPVQKSHTLKFVISASTGERWTKEITVAVAAPERFELFQNYPNPFNPSTEITYQLPADSRVSLKVFNLLGQEVATLVESERLAGHHEERWDARGFASGVYVYQLSLIDEKGNRHIARRAMMLVK